MGQLWPIPPAVLVPGSEPTAASQKPMPSWERTAQFSDPLQASASRPPRDWPGMGAPRRLCLRESAIATVALVPVVGDFGLTATKRVSVSAPKHYLKSCGDDQRTIQALPLPARATSTQPERSRTCALLDPFAPRAGTSTSSVTVVGSGTSYPNSRMHSKCPAIASLISSLVASNVAAAATHPGKSGTCAL